MSSDMVGRKVQIIGPKSKNNGRVGFISSIGNGWVHVRISSEQKKSLAHRVYELKLLPMDEDDQSTSLSLCSSLKQSTKEAEKKQGAESSSKTSKGSRISSADYIGRQVRIRYGTNVNDVGTVTAIRPGYLVIELRETQKVIQKRKSHCELLDDFGLEIGVSEESVQQEGGTAAPSEWIRERRSNRRRNRSRRKGGRNTRNRVYSNPMVAKYIRKKVVVLRSKLVGKVVYYDVKKDLYTVRLNENNLHNLRLLEESNNTIDITCKLKLNVSEIMLWDEYKAKHNISEDKDMLMQTRNGGTGGSTPSNGTVSVSFDLQSISDETDKSRSQRALLRAHRKDNFQSSAMSSTQRAAAENSEILAALQKAQKYRKNMLIQYLKLVQEKDKKWMPYRPNLSKILKRYNAEIPPKQNLLSLDAEDEYNYDSGMSMVSDSSAGDEKQSKVRVTLRQVRNVSMLSKKRKATNEEKEKAMEEAVGRPRLFYDPPLCSGCKMEKFIENGSCWNSSCSASLLFEKSKVSKSASSTPADASPQKTHEARAFQPNPVLSQLTKQGVPCHILQLNQSETQLKSEAAAPGLLLGRRRRRSLEGPALPVSEQVRDEWFTEDHGYFGVLRTQTVEMLSNFRAMASMNSSRPPVTAQQESTGEPGLLQGGSTTTAGFEQLWADYQRQADVSLQPSSLIH